MSDSAKQVLEALSTIKALSIRQPWCHRILHDGKDVENRDWSTKGRGWVLIHASQSLQEDRKMIRSLQLPLGGIVGAMKISDCVTEMDSKWFYGSHGFVISDRLQLPLIPLKGKLGFFDPCEEVRNSIRAFLSGNTVDYDYAPDCGQCGGTGFTFECIDGQCIDAEIGCDMCTGPCEYCS